MINLVLSVEKLNDFQVCPLLYYYKHELRQVPFKKAVYFEEGELIHEMLRVYYQSILDKNELKIVDIINHGRNYAAKKLMLSAAEVEAVVKDTEMYLDYYRNQSSWEILGVEEPFARELLVTNDYRIVLTGKTDLRVKTKGPLALVDHKYESRFDQKVERENQPLAYCWAFDIKDFIYNRIGKQKSKKIEEKLLRPYISYAQYQINDWLGSVRETAEEIINCYTHNNWPMRYHGCNVHGRKCTFYEVCNTTPDNRKYKLESMFKDRDKGSLMGDLNENAKETVSSPEEIQEEG